MLLPPEPRIQFTFVILCLDFPLYTLRPYAYGLPYLTSVGSFMAKIFLPHTHTHTPSPGDSSGTAKHDVFWQCEKQGCYPSGTVLPDSNELKCKAATTLRRSQHLHLVKLRKEMDGQEEAMWWLAMFQVGRTDDIK